jgi:hypothetical protein
LEKGGMPNGSE